MQASAAPKPQSGSLSRVPSLGQTASPSLLGPTPLRVLIVLALFLLLLAEFSWVVLNFIS